MTRERKLPRDFETPHPALLSESNPDFDEIMMRHNISVALDEPGYRDPQTQLFVFNAKALAQLGKCCANSCRHCPFKR